jgi:hypothetical protein
MGKSDTKIFGGLTREQRTRIWKAVSEGPAAVRLARHLLARRESEVGGGYLVS